MNAFKKTLVAIAAAATLGATGLASTQASANGYGSWLRRIWIWRRVWLQPTLVRLQQLFLLRLQLLWLWPSELRLWLRPPLLVTAEFPGFHPSRQALAAADAAWRDRASGDGSPGGACAVP